MLQGREQKGGAPFKGQANEMEAGGGRWQFRGREGQEGKGFLGGTEGQEVQGEAGCQEAEAG